MGGVEEPNYKDFSEYFLPSLTIPHVPSPCVYVRIVVQEVWLVGVFQGFLEGRLLVGPIYPQLIPQAAGKKVECTNVHRNSVVALVDEWFVPEWYRWERLPVHFHRLECAGHLARQELVQGHVALKMCQACGISFLIACTICAVLGEGRWRGVPCSGRGETCTVSSWKIRNREEFRRLGAPKKYNQPPCQQFQSLPLLSHLLLGGPRQLTIVAISEHGFCFLNLTCLHVSVRRVARHVWRGDIWSWLEKCQMYVRTHTWLCGSPL